MMVCSGKPKAFEQKPASPVLGRVQRSSHEFIWDLIRDCAL
jgi:hypothetical protein